MSNFIKLGELQLIDQNAVQSYSAVLSDPTIEERFKKFAGELKRIAPKANEFLYFSTVMITSAEASTLNPDGTVKLGSDGKPVSVSWEKKNGSWKWVCSDKNIKAYKNSNGDIFPEEEIIKAHGLWKSKPLCIDHRSSSVDAIRGIILDTYYDRKHKQVIGLCALDKVSYPDLARGIETGYKTSVSMGTGVGQAICYDCGNVAKVEKDFCNHMKSRSCYGEINIDLQPIELSLVVNGADPLAKIRTIIAAANTVNNRLAAKEKELTILSNSTNLNADTLKLKELTGDIEENIKVANDKLSELKELVQSCEDVNDAAYGQTGDLNSPTDEVNQTVEQLNLPERFAASDNNQALMSEVIQLRASIEDRLHKMEKSLETIQKINEEETMSKDISMNKKEAYFQGGGGVNEPTPGQKKYPADPLNEKLRSEDKHMVGEPPFPGVGDVDGMHPSPASVSEKDELKRKELLSRAERRTAALQTAKEAIASTKKAYFQGGGGVNEPTPGKQKYPVDELEYKLRDKEDKHMVGQKPFPGVGDVDGLHPSPASVQEKDELKRKEMLRRASLKARFVRAANVDGTDNHGGSAWQVFAKSEEGEKLVFTASVDEITGGRADVLFDVVATKDFGTKMLEKIRTEGLTKAASAYKTAQAVSGPGAVPGAPQDMGGPSAVPAMPETGAPVDAAPAPSDADQAADEGAAGDPKDTALKLSEKVRDEASDLLEAVRSLTGEQSQMGEMEQGLEGMPKAASEVLAPMFKMRKQLNRELISQAKKVYAELKDHKEELALVVSALDQETGMNKDYIATIADESFADTEKTLVEAAGLKNAFAKYVSGTEKLIKQAQSVSADEDDKSDANDHFDLSGDDDVLDKDILGSEEELSPDSSHDLGLGLEDVSHDDLAKTDEDHQEEVGDTDLMDINDTTVELPAGVPVPPGAKAVDQTKAAFDLTTKAGRAAFRAKLASDATGKENDGELMDEANLPYTDMLDEAHKLVDGQTELDVKPSDDLGKIETINEQHKKNMEVAKAEPKVRKEAERLNQLVSEGKLSETDFADLVSRGLDAEVVKYWKQYYGQAGKEGSEFAKLLTTAAIEEKAAAEVAAYKVKIARAYELTNEMVRRGMVDEDRTAITAQVEEVMTWNDEGFESMKRVVAKQLPTSLRKQASIPTVGLKNDTETVRSQPEYSLAEELDAAFSNRKF